NAPDPNLIWTDKNQGLFDGSPPAAQWKSFQIDAASAQVDLDAVYQKIVTGSWLVLVGEVFDFVIGGSISTTGGGVGSTTTWARRLIDLYQVSDVTQLSRAAFGVSGKLTRVVTDHGDDLDQFDLRDTFVLAQSEELAVAERPMTHPVFGSTITFGRREP